MATSVATAIGQTLISLYRMKELQNNERALCELPPDRWPESSSLRSNLTLCMQSVSRVIGIATFAQMTLVTMSTWSAVCNASEYQDLEVCEDYESMGFILGGIGGLISLGAAFRQKQLEKMIRIIEIHNYLFKFFKEGKPK